MLAEADINERPLSESMGNGSRMTRQPARFLDATASFTFLTNVTRSCSITLHKRISEGKTVGAERIAGSYR